MNFKYKINLNRRSSVFNSLFKDIEGNRNSFKKKKKTKLSIDYHQKQLNVPIVNEILTIKMQERGK